MIPQRLFPIQNKSLFTEILIVPNSPMITAHEHTVVSCNTTCRKFNIVFTEQCSLNDIWSHSVSKQNSSGWFLANIVHPHEIFPPNYYLVKKNYF